MNGISNACLEAGKRTMLGRQFDWGGRLLNGNGGARRSPHPGWESGHECKGTRHHLTDKRYSGDNRLIFPKSSHRRESLAPRCRLITSWGWSRSQGFGCSPIKVVRELGSERRETVRSLSVMGDGSLRGAAFSTRGPKWTNLWFTSYPAKGKCWVSKSGRDNR